MAVNFIDHSVMHRLKNKCVSGRKGRPMASIGRNESCPCGSGLKFKKCCLPNGSKGIIDASAQRLKERSRQSFFEDGGKRPIVFQDLKGVRKMSEIILEFAEPLLDKAGQSTKNKKKAIALAVVVWNITLMGNISEQLENFIDQMSDEDPQFSDDLSLIVNSLIQRKFDFYSDIQRMVLDYEIVDLGDGIHLNVVSSPLKSDKNAGIFGREAKRIFEAKETFTR
jgi:hypothetical protein